MSIGLQYTGSFKRGFRVESENPLEEVWSQIAMHSASEFISPLRPTNKPEVWKELVLYATVRIRQGVELRDAAQAVTSLTSPLLWYYSFLNLTRGFMAIGPEVRSTNGHGLHFKSGPDILRCSADLLKAGTFVEFLASQGCNQAKMTMSLQDALSRVIEIQQDYVRVFDSPSQVMPLAVEAEIGGEVHLRMPSSYYTILHPTTWQQQCPSLSDCCQLYSKKETFRLIGQTSQNESDISDFLYKHLEDDLSNRNRWYVIRTVEPEFVLPRAAYYFIAMFILGSAVRYEPQLVQHAMHPDAKTSWLLNRFIVAARRYYPHLMLNMVSQQRLYF